MSELFHSNKTEVDWCAASHLLYSLGMGNNKRRVDRALAESSVQICVADQVFIEGHFQDFSRVGARILLPCYLKPKTFVKIGYRDHSKTKQLIHCAVIWIKNTSTRDFEIGLQFIAY